MSTNRFAAGALLLFIMLASGCGNILESPPEVTIDPAVKAELELRSSQIDAYQEALLITESVEEEADLLAALWRISENENISMSVSMIDDAVTIEFLSPSWSRIVNFTVLDVENVRILLSE